MKAVLSVLFALWLAACSARSVAHYKADPRTIEGELTRCLTSGDIDAPDCRNVSQAWYELHRIPAVDGRPVR